MINPYQPPGQDEIVQAELVKPKTARISGVIVQMVLGQSPGIGLLVLGIAWGGLGPLELAVIAALLALPAMWATARILDIRRENP